MPDSMIPEDVREFIFENIDSIAQLEGLLLLHANPKSNYSLTQITERLYISSGEAEHLLQQLQDRGFIERDSKTGFYFYKPKSPSMAEDIAKLSEVYTRYLLSITNLVHSKSKSRVKEFANAFRIRRKD